MEYGTSHHSFHNNIIAYSTNNKIMTTQSYEKMYKTMDFSNYIAKV